MIEKMMMGKSQWSVVDMMMGGGGQWEGTFILLEIRVQCASAIMAN